MRCSKFDSQITLLALCQLNLIKSGADFWAPLKPGCVLWSASHVFFYHTSFINSSFSLCSILWAPLCHLGHKQQHLDVLGGHLKIWLCILSTCQPAQAATINHQHKGFCCYSMLIFVCFPLFSPFNNNKKQVSCSLMSLNKVYNCRKSFQSSGINESIVSSSWLRLTFWN